MLLPLGSEVRKLIEELFPFVYYFMNASSTRKSIESIDSDARLKKRADEYATLDVDQLKSRLTEEHERAVKLDEKTFKFTLSISLGLTLLGTMVAFLVSRVATPYTAKALVVLTVIAVIYILIGGLIALGAVRALPSYGFGTVALISSQGDDARSKFAMWVVKQEKINAVRQLRNEASYQCIRNGLCVIRITIFLFGLAFVYGH